MKKLVLLGLLAVSSLGYSQKAVRFDKKEAINEFFRLVPRRQKPLILAHRGGPGATDTENSLETFRKTFSQVPAAILEMDVRMTRDSVLTLLHDDELERTTTGTGSLKAKTWKELSALFLRDLKGQATTHKMPLFEDVLRWNANRAVLALDTKPGVELALVMKALEKHGALHSVFIICYTVEDARKLRRLYPDLWLALGFTTVADADKIQQAGLPLSRLIALAPRQLQEPVFYQTLHRLGIPCSVGTYGAGNPDELPMPEAGAVYRNYLSRGVDIITTDRPVEVNALFQTP